MVEYGVGNVGSLGHVLRHLGLSFVLTSDPDTLDQCDRLILPGVGAFAPAMERLKSTGLIPFITRWAEAGRPLLGICLGMQLLLDESEERGHNTGLGLIAGKVRKIRGAPRDVHMGWNDVRATDGSDWTPARGYGYFVHSYHCILDNPASVLATTSYGEII
ncbi:imidazole glycerol phosphate synthase subunit HisH, partial [Candidatus Neomarinimicrobiota bacterium]